MVHTLLEQFRQTPLIEWFAFSFAILQVVFAYRNKTINFLFGAISVCAYIYIFYQADLIAESILNLYYLIVSLVGLVLWNQKDRSESVISRASAKQLRITGLIILMTMAVVLGIYFFRQATMAIDMMPAHYLDALVTAFAFGGTYLLLKRSLETWFFLNISNLIAMPLQWSKGLYLTAFLTFILFNIAMSAWFRWRRIIST